MRINFDLFGAHWAFLGCVVHFVPLRRSIWMNGNGDQPKRMPTDGGNGRTKAYRVAARVKRYVVVITREKGNRDNVFVRSGGQVVGLERAQHLDG